MDGLLFPAFCAAWLIGAWFFARLIRYAQRHHTPDPSNYIPLY